MLHHRLSTHRHTYGRQARQIWSKHRHTYDGQARENMMFSRSTSAVLQMLWNFWPFFLRVISTTYPFPAAIPSAAPLAPHATSNFGINRLWTWLEMSYAETSWIKEMTIGMLKRNLYRAFWVSKHCKGDITRWCNSGGWRFEPVGSHPLVWENQSSGVLRTSFVTRNTVS